MQLVSLKTANDGVHKYVAEFKKDDGSLLHTKFGASGMTDYTRDNKLSRDQRKSRYLARHKSAENWSDPTSAGALSRWILWNKPTVSASLADFRSRFNL
jgi:hypothetical protein